MGVVGYSARTHSFRFTAWVHVGADLVVDMSARPMRVSSSWFMFPCGHVLSLCRGLIRFASQPPRLVAAPNPSPFFSLSLSLPVCTNAHAHTHTHTRTHPLFLKITMARDPGRRLRGRVEALELYDLVGDPSESTNAAANASYGGALADLTLLWRGGWQVGH